VSALLLSLPRASALAAPLLVAVAAVELLVGAAIDPGSTALTRELPRKLQPTDAARLYREPQPQGSVARMLREEGGRVLFGWHVRSLNMEADTGLPAPLDGSLNGPLGDEVETVGGYDAVQPRRYWSYTRAVVRPLLPYNRTLIDRPDAATLNLLDVGWMVLAAGERPSAPATEQLSSGRFTLWRLTPAPRVQLFAGWATAASDAAALAAVTAPGFDPARNLVVESLPAKTDGPSATAHLVERSAERLVVETRSTDPSVLLVRQSYDPFWHAEVDGRPARMYVADAFEPSVAVPAGHHRVVLSYDDPWIARGLVISARTLAVWLAACAVAGRRQSPLSTSQS
jgi:hypothetical protein